MYLSNDDLGSFEPKMKIITVDKNKRALAYSSSNGADIKSRSIFSSRLKIPWELSYWLKIPQEFYYRPRITCNKGTLSFRIHIDCLVWGRRDHLNTTILPPRRKKCFTQMKMESLWKITFAQTIPNKSDRYDLTKRPCDAVVFYFIDLFSI